MNYEFFLQSEYIEFIKNYIYEEYSESCFIHLFDEIIFACSQSKACYYAESKIVLNLSRITEDSDSIETILIRDLINIFTHEHIHAVIDKFHEFDFDTTCKYDNIALYIEDRYKEESDLRC